MLFFLEKNTLARITPHTRGQMQEKKTVNKVPKKSWGPWKNPQLLNVSKQH
jgi:hypothetical protein